MTYNSTSGLYEYNRTFSSAGLVDWNVTCDATNYESLLVLDDVEIVLVNNAPVVDSNILNSTLGTNLTSENLTVNIVSSDADGDSVKNITDWRKDGTSIAVLNMPFENHSATSSLAIDYTTYGNNGTVTGATFNATGGRDGNGAYEFTGANDYIDILTDSTASDFDSLSDNITVTAWVLVVKSVELSSIEYRSEIMIFDNNDGVGRGRMLHIALAVFSNLTVEQRYEFAETG